MATSADGSLLAGFTDEQLGAVKWACEGSQEFFSRFLFRALERQVFRSNPMASLINSTLDRVVDGEITRLLINMPPGLGKTLLGVIMFAARGFALNPRCRFLHASYSQTLVQQNSQTIRTIMALPEYQILWPRQLRADSSAKGLWATPEGGMFKASPSAGEITGFRAGTLDSIGAGEWDDEAWFEDFNEPIGDPVAPEFSGALIVDDAVKPDDARYAERLNAVNGRYNNTLRSRLAHERVPIIGIGQRIAPMDFSGYLLTGGGGEKFYHLMLPVEIKRQVPDEIPAGATRTGDKLGRPWPLPSYPAEYTHGIQIKHALPEGPLWSLKYNKPQIDILRKSSRVFAAQYLQDPRTSENEVFKPELYRGFDVRPRTISVAIIGDPSGDPNAKKNNDRTALVVIGIDENANKFLLDGYCHRMTLSERWDNLKRLYQRWHVGAMPGVQNCVVGYEKFGLQADLSYFRERMALDGPMFPITEISWPRSGASSKEARIERLEPEFKNNQFYMPMVVYRPEEGGADNKAYWSSSDRGVHYRAMQGLTSDMRRVSQAGEGFRVMDKPILRRDENRQLYDLTILLMEELRDFPNAKYDDLSDAVSRIYDLNLPVPNRREDDEVRAANERLEA